MLRKTEFITLKLYEKLFLSFRRSKVTEKSEQKKISPCGRNDKDTFYTISH